MFKHQPLLIYGENQASPENTGTQHAWVLYLITLFFLEHIIYIGTKLRLMNVFYALAACFVAAKLVFQPLSVRPALALFCYTSVVVIFTLFGVIVNGSTSISIQQSVYYLKPTLFFLLGYYYLSGPAFSKLINFIYWLSVSGTVFFFLFPDQILAWAGEHLALQNFGVYEAFGFISRNISWYVSPLEFAALCMFLVFFLAEERKRYWGLKVFMCVLMIGTTFSRSIVIAGIGAYCLSKIRLRAANLIAIFSLGIVLVAVLLIFDEFFLRYFVHDGSATVHNEVLFESIHLVLNHPFGLGIGASGWPGYDQALRRYFYSEGSVAMMFIEIGWLAAPILAGLTFASFLVSRNFGLLCVAFLIASLIVPIGVSTYFICLFFLYFGMKVSRSNV